MPANDKLANILSAFSNALNMLLLRPLLRLLTFGAIALLIWQCAQPGSPTGGPKDETPPEVNTSKPAIGTLNYKEKKVRIVFSEPIRKPTFDKEIFISPFVKRPKVLLSDNAKRILIKFEEDLLPRTTYVVSLSGLKDQHESNEMKEAFTLAFSTGDVLDSMRLRGKVISPVYGEKVEDVKLLLFDGDSIVGTNFFMRRPAYLTKINEQGAFDFQYLRRDTFKLIGVVDKDQTNTYSTSSEVIAIPVDTLLAFPGDTNLLGEVALFLSRTDNDPPRIRGFSWLTQQTLRLEFDENLRLDSLQIIRTDTLNQDSLDLPVYTWWPGAEAPRLLLHVPDGKVQEWNLHFSHVQDSLWQRLDTVLRVTPLRNSSVDNPLLNKPQLELKWPAWDFLTYRRFQAPDSVYFSLTDTSRYDSLRQVFPLRVEAGGFRLKLRPDSLPDPAAPYVLRVDGQFFAEGDTGLTDSIFRYPVKWYMEENLGNVAGSIRLDSAYQGPVVVNLLPEKGRAIRSGRDTTFTYDRLEPGTYKIEVIFDADSNGVWTPGSLTPYRLPERIYRAPEGLTVRANWEFEDQLIEVKTGQMRQAVADTVKGDSLR
jgi:hypothetical protein